MHSFRDIPIRQKLMVVTMLTTTAALILAGVGTMVSDSVLLHASLARGVSSLAHIVADNSTAAVAFDDPRAAAEMLATLKVRTHLESACIYLGNGTVLASVHSSRAKHRDARQSIRNMKFGSPRKS